MTLRSRIALPLGACLLASSLAVPAASAQSANLPIGSAREGASSDAIDASSDFSASTLPDGSSISAGSSNSSDPWLSSIGGSSESTASSRGEGLGSSIDAYETSSRLSSRGLTEFSSGDSTGEDPGIDYGTSPKLLDTRHVEDNSYEIDVWSPANHTVITNLLILPAGGTDNPAPRPTLYLLSGADGGVGVNWRTASDYEDFFADKDVQVVTPIGGGSSLYMDWMREDLSMGAAQWQTYICEELPQVMDFEFHGNGRNAIAGISMSGGPALHMAGAYPGLFSAAASLSGYPANSGLLGRMFITNVVDGKGGSSINALGLFTDPSWEEIDPSAHLERLQNVPGFVGTGAGIPTLRDLTGDWAWWFFLEILSQVFSNYFTRQAESAGVQVERYYTVFGTHNYLNFERELRVGWERTLGPALGVA
ncbi:alpha/beta hydrolase [Corynebacterium vitaeruminis]|uniref:Esterase n=1 Tax=Corynebacterium vitaeruminis DSM 20294 TaxID=1224164 RepID=W5Y3W9_9CORY|nr:alpha/beta hydrolase-fold protein [Corynebacterium vitaeruminis]AHI23560.1 esterase [Corynebacterium vitaeruminis DSM 20294]